MDGVAAEPLIELAGVEKVFTVRRRAGRLRRTRHEVRAVDGLTFQVSRGEMVGFIGPNGAGKSTTIKMLTGILVPSGGRLRVAGIDPSPSSRLRSNRGYPNPSSRLRSNRGYPNPSSRLRSNRGYPNPSSWLRSNRGYTHRERTRLARRIGVVFGQRTTLWWDLPLKDSYELVRRMYRVPPAVFRANLDRCIELLDLAPLLDVPVRQLSLGQRMRGDIAAALLHDPDVLYLDEPTIGLDVVSKAKVRSFLREINAERGTTVLLTTHDLTDIEQLCRRVMVIDHGRLVFDGDLAGLRAAADGERTLVVDLAEELPPIEGVPGARTVKVEGPRQWLAFPAERSAAPLVTAIAARYPLVDLAVREPDIEALIAELYAGGGAARRDPGGADPAAPDPSSP
ncbi:ATP-binding cassette domain-containing protein [Streptomyces noursei]|uniref:ABC transporter ATP-binding protein n=1 Tax=Streptomyces noursei TaxID=1971 RepID=UPI001678969D|nr:ATP-binding cassette domain-containing protein [Streptomyces noursei]MCZ1016008.1 ATP-binding cassette domain-containing protein [Streptomyces noursei]GGW92331.1 ABC transporter ATP-binding protein [Streptomyces noursei]